MPKAKKRRPSTPAGKPIPYAAVEGLAEAEELTERGRFAEARSVLEPLARRYPREKELWGALVNLALDLKDIKGYQVAAERYLEASPNDMSASFGLAGAYMLNASPMLALRTFRRAVDRWPEYPRAAEARETIARLEGIAPELVGQLGLSGAEGMEVAMLHDEVRSLIERGDYREARKVARELLRRHPGFASALNNISLSYSLEGRYDRAIDAAREVLRTNPDNFHALANLTRYLLVTGDPDEAARTAERLKAVEWDVADAWTKKAEALSYLGDDQGVLDAYAGAERGGYLKDGGPEQAFICHLAAVASFRLGREREARKRWKQALGLSPGFELATANLDDLRKPVGERNAPWPFSFGYWIPGQTAADVVQQTQRASRQPRDDAMREAVRRFLRQHPEVVALAPHLLDRGDAGAREFIVRVGAISRTPELLEALRVFALGHRGSDALRHTALAAASDAGLLRQGPVRFWTEGEWREILVASFEVYDEPVGGHSPQVEEWAQQAMVALREKDSALAERLLLQALEQEPDSPDLLNNLAKAYEMQGRTEESNAMLLDLRQRYPEYLFARIGAARLLLREDKIEEAEALLGVLRERRRFHISEGRAYSAALIELYVAKGERTAATSWLEMWEEMDPDNPDIEEWWERLAPPLPPLRGLPSPGRGRSRRQRQSQ